MRKKGKKSPNSGKKPGGIQVYLHLDPSVLDLLEKLHKVMNEKLKAAGRLPIIRSKLLTVIVTDALLEHAGDIQEESAEMGLNRLAVRLAPLFGTDGLAAAGLPEVPDNCRARSFSPRKFLSSI